ADADHLDIYGDQNQLHESFALFLNQLHADGIRIVKNGLPFGATIRYAAGIPADAYADRIRIQNGQFFFDYIWKGGRISDIQLGVPGEHNVENAVAAIAVAQRLQISEAGIVKALASFSGVKRRFEY